MHESGQDQSWGGKGIRGSVKAAPLCGWLLAEEITRQIGRKPIAITHCRAAYAFDRGAVVAGREGCSFRTCLLIGVRRQARASGGA